jgi:hypothetical protein
MAVTVPTGGVVTRSGCGAGERFDGACGRRVPIGLRTADIVRPPASCTGHGSSRPRHRRNLLIGVVLLLFDHARTSSLGHPALVDVQPRSRRVSQP